MSRTCEKMVHTMPLKHRLCILGLDSLPPGLTRQLASDGTMPFLNELIAKGSFGTLNSVVPANTGAGWNSAWTGLQPSEHGYFGFHHYDLADDTVHISTSERLRQTTLWEKFNQHGLKTVVINSPMQFPATALDGVMVSGFMTPSLDSACSWPRDFKDTLYQEIPDYLFDLRWRKDQSDDETFQSNIESVKKVFKQRVEAAKLGAAWGAWDVLIIVFKSCDNMLHYSWDYLEDEGIHPRRSKLVREAFGVLDDCCRELATLSGYPETNILICSDHGHGSVKGHFFVNRQLAQWGFLKLQNRIDRISSKFITSCRKRLGIDKEKKKPSAYLGRRFGVAWPRSQAIMINSGVIYLNVKGRQPHGTVEPGEYQSLRQTIAEKLQSLQRPDGSNFIMKIECPEQATVEKLSEGQPAVADILFEASDGILLRSTTTQGDIWLEGRPDNLQGCHRFEGMVLGCGPAFSKNKEIQGDLPDIAPTALAACSLPIPMNMTGKVIADLIGDHIPVTYEEQSAASEAPPSSAGEESYSHQEEDLITRRLTDLGYL